MIDSVWYSCPSYESLVCVLENAGIFISDA